MTTELLFEELLEHSNSDIIEARKLWNKVGALLDSYVYDSGEFSKKEIKKYEEVGNNE